MTQDDNERLVTDLQSKEKTISDLEQVIEMQKQTIESMSETGPTIQGTLHYI
jgi:hypothetical protein